MAGVKVTIDFEALRRKLSAAAEVLRDPRPVLEEIAEWMKLTARKAFESESAPEGAKWAPLTPGSQRQKDSELREMGRGLRPILERSGALFATLHAGVEGNLAFVESPQPYAAAHQFGHTFPPMEIRPVNARALRWFGKGGEAIFAQLVRIPERELPARPFLPGEELAEKKGAEIAEDKMQMEMDGR